MSKNFIFIIAQTRQQFTLELDENLQLRDVADYFLDNTMISSIKIGIFSQNTQYFTENLDEQLRYIGNGEGDTYLILEGNEKNNYKNYQEHNFQQQQQVQQQYQEGSDLEELKIIIRDGETTRTLNLQFNLATTTLNDVKQAVETYLAIGSLDYATVDMFLETICFSGQEKLIKLLKQLNVSKTTKIEARVRYIGGFLLVINDEFP